MESNVGTAEPTVACACGAGCAECGAAQARPPAETGCARVGSERAVAALQSRLRRLARAERQAERTQVELDSRLDAIKGLYTGRLSALGRAAAVLRAGIEAFCRARRRELTCGGSKSVRTPCGKVGFRRVGPTVACAPGADEEQVCEGLEGNGLGRFVRVRRAPEWAAIRRAVSKGELDPERLRSCGVHLAPAREAFYCVIDRARTGSPRAQ